MLRLPFTQWLIAVAVVIAIMVIRRLYLANKGNKVQIDRFGRIMPLYEMLEEDEPLTEKDVLPYARNVMTRAEAYGLLKEYGKTELFPQEYYTMEKASESQLANWIELYSDIAACPDEIKYQERVYFDAGNPEIFYETFRYKMMPPHPAANYGWLTGAVGPFRAGSRPYEDEPEVVYSRVKPSESPEAEVKWIHANVSAGE